MQETQDNYIVRQSRAEKWLQNNLALVLAIIVALAAVLALVAAVTYLRYYPGPILQEHSKWGEFGDFFGGTLNPIFGFLTLIALLLTVILQSRELANSTKELATTARALERQNFERTFFELLRLYNENVSAIDLRDREEGTVTAVGRDCIRILYEKRFRPIYNEVLTQNPTLDLRSIIDRSYDKFFAQEQHEIGHCFRALYWAFKFIDESGVVDKGRYAGIMRAQLSSYELALLFYNVLHRRGSKFQPLIEKYALFEHASLKLLFDPPNHIPLYAEKAYGDLDISAFEKNRLDHSARVPR